MSQKELHPLVKYAAIAAIVSAIVAILMFIRSDNEPSSPPPTDAKWYVLPGCQPPMKIKLLNEYEITPEYLVARCECTIYHYNDELGVIAIWCSSDKCKLFAGFNFFAKPLSACQKASQIMDNLVTSIQEGSFEQAKEYSQQLLGTDWHPTEQDWNKLFRDFGNRK
jgi:hypothetical protein